MVPREHDRQERDEEPVDRVQGSHLRCVSTQADEDRLEDEQAEDAGRQQRRATAEPGYEAKQEQDERQQLEHEAEVPMVRERLRTAEDSQPRQEYLHHNARHQKPGDHKVR